MPPPKIEMTKILDIWPSCIFKKGSKIMAIIKNLIEVNKNGGNSPTPIFADMKAAPNPRFINKTRKISLVFKLNNPQIKTHFFII